DCTGIPETPKQFDERRKLVVRIQAARIGQDPDRRPLEALRLASDRGVLQGEGVAVGTPPEEREHLRAIAPDLGGEALAAGDELLRRELVGGRRAAVDEVRDPVTCTQELVLL